jgi:hypothetical protein
MEADLTVRGTHQLALRLSLAISKESARAINVSRHFIRTLALRCSCMCAPMTESGIRRVGIFIFLPPLNLLPNDKINSIKHGSPDNKRCRQRAPASGLPRDLDSATMPRADNTIRTGETQESKINTATNRNHHECLPSPRFNHMHCRECDLARCLALLIVREARRPSDPK